jgi:hypothetical protein
MLQWNMYKLCISDEFNAYGNIQYTCTSKRRIFLLFSICVEDIQCFLMNMKFISQVRQDFQYFHECEARVKII